MIGKKKTTEQFITDATKVHNDKYSYINTVYERALDKVIITCPEHGDFEQTPNAHLKGSGCPKCSGRGKTTELIIQEFKKVHGGKYDYSKTEYKNSTTKVIITCPEHGDYKQLSGNHLKGSGCPTCWESVNGESKRKHHNSKKYWNFKQPEDHKLIPLTQGKFAKVDNEDFDSVKDINWRYDKGYAMSSNVGYMHRFVMNAPDDMLVDHKDVEETLDNRKSNLRLATRSQNNSNQRNRKGSSLYKGVSWNKLRSKWAVGVSYNKLSYYLGLFADEKEAGMAYDRKALELQGEFAYLNFPELKEQYLKEIKKKNHE